MSDIKIDTTQMATSAKQLKSKANEMDSAVTAANNSFEPCNSMTSKRVKRRAEEWNTIREKFKKTLEEMLTASEKLLKAAQDFETTDESD